MPQITLLTGPERRRHWSDEDRQRIMVAAFSRGAVVSNVGRQFEVSTSLIYKWRRQALAGQVLAGGPVVAFVPAVVTPESAPVTPGSPATPPSETMDRTGAAAIVVELTNGTRLTIGAHASAALVSATLRALR